MKNAIKNLSEIINRRRFFVVTVMLIAILLASYSASAGAVTYYLNATGGVNIGADGVTSVTGGNQNIPPVITALLDKNNLNNNDARSNNHPTGLYNHSRWYFTSDYTSSTMIGSNPSGIVVLRGGYFNTVIIRLFDYDPASGSKNLIGSSSPITTINGSNSNTISNYTINSSPYSVPRNHRLMLQFDFNQNWQYFPARVYADSSNSYLTVIETPITYNVTVESIPSSATLKAGENFIYSIIVNNTGTTDGNYSLIISDSDTINFLPSVIGMNTLSVPAGGSKQTTLIVTANGTAPKDAVDTTTFTATSIENSIYTNITQTVTTVTIPITYNVTVNSTPSSARIKAGENFVYSITVNNTGTTNGSYNLGVSDSDPTNFSSILSQSTLLIPAGGSNQTTLMVTANGTAPKDAVDTTTITATSIENPLYTNITQTMTTVEGQSLSNCAQCHESYQMSLNSSKHNQTRNSAAPNCTLCHTGYDARHTGFVVNESNTCRTCHNDTIAGINTGFYERHTGSSDCTTCHFANTTQPFLNTSLYSHDHNLTVEHNFYEYNQSGIPVRTNGGVGVGMFPYYTCTLTCHKYNATTGVEGKIDEAATSWFNSSHSRSLHMAGDNKMSCARCKSPLNYNVSANQSSLIDQPDWQGIQCRVCHNLHDRKFPNNTGPGGFPIAFYNSTATSNLTTNPNGSAIYDKLNNATELCEKCHNGVSHDSKFAGTHKDPAGLNFTCISCHMNSSFKTELHTFEVKNTTSNVTGCAVCHKPENHTFQATSKHTGKVECVACHDQTVSRNATNYSVSSDNNYGIYKDPTVNEWTTYKTSHGAPASWPLHNVTKSVSCNKCHNGAQSVYNGTIGPDIPDSDICGGCHATYSNAVLSTSHNQTLNPGAPNCTDCHTGYQPVYGHTSGNRNYTVNETNTCRNCHIDNISGFYERHTSSSDCTTCHFANTTKPFEYNASFFKHDHNLTVEHNFYEYNKSGIPVRTNNGTGVGMFPYYTCTLTCHKYNATTGVEGKIDEAATSWLQSNHARSLRYPAANDNKNNCAKCKSPVNYNDSEKLTNPNISAQDWQGIQCRVCHNLHDRKFPNNTGPGSFPIAFYNSTATSNITTNPNGSAIYDKLNNATELCEKCHNGASHDSKFAGTHKDPAGLNFTCINCHMNSSFKAELHTFEVKNTTSGVTGCEVCHKSENHTFQFTSNHSGKVTCEACHDKTVARNATGYAVSSDSKTYGLYLDPLTAQVSSWKDSHGTPSTWPLHNISKEVNCNKCHGTYSIYNGSVKQSTLIADEIQCMSCHNTAQGPMNDPAKYPTIAESLITKHKNVNNSTGADVLDSNDCKTCHYDTTNMSNVLTYSCEDCHNQGNFSAPITKNHVPNGLRIRTDAYCSICHNNSISNYAYSANASVSHYMTNTSLINTSNCIECHNGAYTNNASWGSPVNISTSIKRNHNETQTSQCDLCHKDRSIPSLESVDFHNAGLQSDINNCMGCHPTVTSLDMGGHSIFNGTNATDNGDCRTCHKEICQMKIGYSNKSNTYYCQDCHTYNGIGPKKSRIIWQERKHGRAECINCHIADGQYHQGNPRGSVANSTYFNRYSTPNINTTDCADCHYAANLDDAPFYAPGGGEHTITPGIGGNGACVNSCHRSGNTMSKSMHAVDTRSMPYLPTITIPVLNRSTVIKGTNVSLTARVDFAYIYALIDGAQYRIMSGNEMIKPWTPMLAVDGNFNGTHEAVTAVIETNLLLPGTYIVEVRGMAGGPAQDWSIRYYPMNGEVSITQNTTLTIQAPMGYINGTVTSGGSNLSGAMVYTTGVNDITKSDGTYSLSVPEGNYTVTANKLPTYGDNTTSTEVKVTQSNTTTVDFSIDLKPTGAISGAVTNV